MAKTPDRTGLPAAASKTLFTRYTYAQTHGFEGLKKISEKRITNIRHGCLHQFFKWLKDKKILPSNTASRLSRPVLRSPISVTPDRRTS